MLARRRMVAQLHSQLGKLVMQHRRLPRSVVAAYQSQSSLGGLDGSSRIAGVLAHVAQPLTRGQRRVPVGLVRERLEPAPERIGISRVEGEHYFGRPAETGIAAGVKAQPLQHRSDRTDSLFAGDHRVAQQHGHRGAGDVFEFRWWATSRAPPVATGSVRTIRRPCSPRIAQNIPRRRKQLDESAGVAVANRAAQLVGQIDLLEAQRVDRLELLRRPAGARRSGGRGRSPIAAGGRAPRGPRRRRRAASGRTRARSRAFDTATPARVSRTLKSDWSTRPWTASTASSPSTARAASSVNPSWNSGEPPQRASLVGVEQVPRPVDDREQRLVAVGCAAIAAAQQRESVLQAAVDLLHGHGPNLGGGELDRQWETIEPSDDAGHDAVVQVGGRARRQRPFAEQLSGVARRRAARAGRRARPRSPAALGSW